jgi:hypothetical protein
MLLDNREVPQMNANKRDLVENQMAEAEKKQREEFKTQIAQFLKHTEKEFNNDLKLSDVQQEWVQKSLGDVLKQDRILKDSKNGDEYEEFTEDDKDALKPAIRQALELRALETRNSAVTSYLQGKFYKGVHEKMQTCGIKKYRGFCKLTGCSHTTVYRKVKIAENYTRESVENHPGVDLKALYEVAARKGKDADEVLEKNHEALVKAGSDIHEVRKVLNPEYKPERPIPSADGVATSRDGTLRAQFYLRKAKLVIEGVSEEDWANFQVWFNNQDLWCRFKAHKTLKDQELEDQESEDLVEREGTSTQVDTPESVEATGSPFEESKKVVNGPAPSPEQTMAAYETSWDASNTRADDGNINVCDAFGIEYGDKRGLYGDLFIRCPDENGEEQVFREPVKGVKFPTTSAEYEETWERVGQDYPKVKSLMLTEQDEFVVGTKILEGNPVTRWRQYANG